MSSTGVYLVGDLALTPPSELRTMGSIAPFATRIVPHETPLGERIGLFEHAVSRVLGMNGNLGEAVDPLLDWAETFDFQEWQALQRFQEANSVFVSLVELLEGRVVRGPRREWQELLQLRWEASILLERVTPRRALCNEFYKALVYPFPSFMRGERSILFATPLTMLDCVFEAPAEEVEEAIAAFLARVREQVTNERYLQFARTTGDESRLIRAQRNMREHEDRMEMLTILEAADE